MKFTVAAAALIGATSAHMKCPFHHFWQRTNRTCPDRDESQMMGNHQFVRRAKQTMANNLVKGWYHDPRDQVLDERCLGTWMDDKMHSVHEVFHNLHHEGIWAVSHQDLKDATNNMWDLVLLNVEYCDMYRFFYNNYEWCMNDIEKCGWHEGFADRVINNGFKYAMDAYTLYSNYEENQDCETDEHVLGKIGKSTELIAADVATVTGFEGKWNKNSKFEKLTFHEMHHNIHAKKHGMPHPHGKCPFKTIFEHFFPDFQPIVQEIENDISWVKQMLTFGPPHHERTHHEDPTMAPVFGFPPRFNRPSPFFGGWF